MGQVNSTEVSVNSGTNDTTSQQYNSSDNERQHKYKPLKDKPLKDKPLKDKPLKENIRIGYNLLPLVEANKDSAGGIFICIGERKIPADVKKYKHIKCWISLKNKFKKKGKKNHIILVY
eukprot:487443_1